MDTHDWIYVALTLLGMSGCCFVYVRSEMKTARHAGTVKDAVLNTKLEAVERDGKTSLFNAKKEVLATLKERSEDYDSRLAQMERHHEAGRNAITQELKEIVATFTRTCDGLQSKLEHLTTTIIGQYVPRQELDNRLSRYEEKQDRILTALYEMKK